MSLKDKKATVVANGRLLHVLHWHRPGAVWAMDHTEPPTPIDGRWPHVLAVRDLASHMQLAWLPVASWITLFRCPNNRCFDGSPTGRSPRT